MKFTSTALCLAAISQSALAFAPSSNLGLQGLKTTSTSTSNSKSLFLSPNNFHQEEELAQFDFPTNNDNNTNKHVAAAASTAAVMALSLSPLAANAIDSIDIPSMSTAAAAANDAIPSAIAAYVHYLSLFAIVSAVTYERSTIEAGMSKEVEDSVALADITLGVSGTTLLVSGYYRAVDYGKGWYFYSHEPIFWLKMIFLCIFGAASFFPTATIIKRAVPVATGKAEFVPMSDKLATRMKKVLNAEIVMLASIPLSATLMSRGVLYTESIPVQYIGPALCAVTIGGLGYKYINEALTWTEDDDDVDSGSAAAVKEVEDANKAPTPIEKLQTEA